MGNIYFFGLVKLILIPVFLIILNNLSRIKNILNSILNNTFIKANNNSQYFFCFCAVAKNENLYSSELIVYYMNLGVDKFIFIDNNFS